MGRENVGDPRITFLEDWYYIAYTGDSRYGHRLALARTKDFVSVERLGFVSQPDTKHGALFPEKVGGRYCRLERPREGGAIWLSYSDDLVYWGGTSTASARARRRSGSRKAGSSSTTA